MYFSTVPDARDRRPVPGATAGVCLTRTLLGGLCTSVGWTDCDPVPSTATARRVANVCHDRLVVKYGNLGEFVHRISKSFAFSASHRLRGLPDGHKCSRLHGHTYGVKITLEGPLDSVGFVVDFAELSWIAALIDDELDHRHLNDVLKENPTSENLATWFAVRVGEWVANSPAYRITGFGVDVSESPRTSAALWLPVGS